MILFGIQPPAEFPAEWREWYRREHETSLELTRSDPPLPGPSDSFDDPPFVLREDLNVAARRRTSTSLVRVLNDVYARTPKGKKWHRIYEVGAVRTPGLERFGRPYLFPCGQSASQFDRDDRGEFIETPLRAEIPPATEICKACAQSDRTFGKGDLPPWRCGSTEPWSGGGSQRVHQHLQVVEVLPESALMDVSPAMVADG
jgi:hypothetical protein